MQVVNLIGLASNSVTKLQVSTKKVNCLEFLRENGVPIASSCDGKGLCKKCVINETKLACKTTLNEVEEIRVSYL